MRIARAFQTLALVGATLATLTPAASARPHRGTGGGPFGLGIVVGQPTGITAQWYRRSPGFGQAFELALGLDVVEDDNFYLHGTWKFYVAQLARSGDLDVPLYLGIGAFLFDHGNDNLDNLHLGVRAPLGIALEFHSVPLEIFFELALRVIVIDDHDHGHDDIDLGGAIGFRYYF